MRRKYTQFKRVMKIDMNGKPYCSYCKRVFENRYQFAGHDCQKTAINELKQSMAGGQTFNPGPSMVQFGTTIPSNNINNSVSSDNITMLTLINKVRELEYWNDLLKRAVFNEMEHAKESHEGFFDKYGGLLVCGLISFGAGFVFGMLAHTGSLGGIGSFAGKRIIGKSIDKAFKMI